MAGNARNRKPLSQDRIDLLNSIDFKWVGESHDSRGYVKWAKSMQKIASFIEKHGEYPKAGKSPKETNLYNSLARTKRLKNKGDLEGRQQYLLDSLGIDLDFIISNSERDGYTKWANKLNEISAFINTHGHYPKAGTDKKQSNLYQSLAQTKRALKNNELSEKQLELLQELNIELE